MKRKYLYKNLFFVPYYGAYRVYYKTPDKCFLLCYSNTKKAAIANGKYQIDKLNER